MYDFFTNYWQIFLLKSKNYNIYFTYIFSFKYLYFFITYYNAITPKYGQIRIVKN